MKFPQVSLPAWGARPDEAGTIVHIIDMTGMLIVYSISCDMQ